MASRLKCNMPQNAYLDRRTINRPLRAADQMMLKRAFLLLLALMTGLSVAEAAGATRPVADRAEVCHSITPRAAACLAPRVIRAAYGLPIAETGPAYQRIVVGFANTTDHIAPVACVHRSDRRRE
jgi:hypothetical protein